MLLEIDDEDLAAMVAREGSSTLEDASTAATTNDGISHQKVGWSFPEALPCLHRSSSSQFVAGAASCLLSTSAERRAAHPGRAVAVHNGDLRRAALVALGCLREDREAAAAADPDSKRVGYLQSKRPVDKRSRSRLVENEVVSALRKMKGPLRFVDVGAGALSMLEPMTRIAQEAGCEHVSYLAIDSDRSLLDAGLRSLDASWRRVSDDEWSRSEPSMSLRCCAVDAFEFSDAGLFDVVVANAFADLAPPPRVHALLKRLMKPSNAIAYLPITFGGRTWLDPPLCAGDDAGFTDLCAFEAYHDHLRRVECQSLDVEALVEDLSSGLELTCREASDWRLDLGCPEDAAFASFIVDFICASVPPIFFGTPRAEAAVAWAAALQGETGRHLCAANHDLLFRRPDP